MKILKKGRPQKGWSTKVKCTGYGYDGSGCGAELLVEQSDLFKTSSSDMTGDTEHFVTFKCISCGVLTDLKNPPGHLWDDLPDKDSWEQAQRPLPDSRELNR